MAFLFYKLMKRDALLKLLIVISVKLEKILKKLSSITVHREKLSKVRKKSMFDSVIITLTTLFLRISCVYLTSKLDVNELYIHSLMLNSKIHELTCP